MIEFRPVQLRAAALIALGVLSAAACSTNNPAPPVDSKVAALCASACRSVAVCFKSQEPERPPFKDLVGCEKQCALEVAGGGYLAKDVANLIMSSLAAAEPTGGDVDCKLQAGSLQFGVANFQATLEDAPYLERCTDEAVKVCGTDIQSRDGWRSDCFRKQYTYNAEARKKFEACSGIQECRAWGLCRAEASRSQSVCKPWFGPDGAKCLSP